MEKIWHDMYQAALNVLNPREVSEVIRSMRAAWPRRWMESEPGKIYVACAWTPRVRWAYAPRAQRDV